eukprot:TRINITY_DN3786_c1_g1_i2.p1 TRINITY_DN3786_c1_g1~~TRINITY_DN3786_c1_g1_i2.p1  ORF type:complete len:680 (+),score=203.46 TRINITY_DN3786_c1_g1_i2:354-2393(+)
MQRRLRVLRRRVMLLQSQPIGRNVYLLGLLCVLVFFLYLAVHWSHSSQDQGTAYLPQETEFASNLPPTLPSEDFVQHEKERHKQEKYLEKEKEEQEAKKDIERDNQAEARKDEQDAEELERVKNEEEKQAQFEKETEQRMKKEKAEKKKQKKEKKEKEKKEKEMEEQEKKEQEEEKQEEEEGGAPEEGEKDGSGDSDPLWVPPHFDYDGDGDTGGEEDTDRTDGGDGVTDPNDDNNDDNNDDGNNGNNNITVPESHEYPINEWDLPDQGLSWPTAVHMSDWSDTPSCIAPKPSIRVPCYPLPVEKGRSVRSQKHMCLPSFLLIGAMKAATTWTDAALNSHPNLGGAKRKELFFFNRQYRRGIEWYGSQFVDVMANRERGDSPGGFPFLAPQEAYLQFESTPSYLFSPTAPLHAFWSLRDAYIIVILRNPIERSYSQYFHAKAWLDSVHLTDPDMFKDSMNQSFEEMVDEEISLLTQCGVVMPTTSTKEEEDANDKSSSDATLSDSYSSQSFSSSPAAAAADAYSSSASGFGASAASDFEPPLPGEWTFYKERCAQAGGCRFCYPKQTSQHEGDGHPAFGMLSRSLYVDQLAEWLMYYPRDRVLLVDYEEIVNEKQKALNRITDFLGVDSFTPDFDSLEEEANSNDYEPMSEELRAKLRTFFEGPNQRLYSLLGRDFDWQ